MNKKSLNKIKNVYENGGNLIQYLKDAKNLKNNTDEMIMISYDFQSGSYIDQAEKNPEFNEKYTKAISETINKLDISYDSILEVGVGEATTIANLIRNKRGIS